MSHTPNELSDIFPDKADKIHELKAENPLFANMFDKYHDLTREIHRGETDVEPMDDFHLEDLRKERLRLLDNISPFLNP